MRAGKKEREIKVNYRVADYIFDFLADKGLKNVFLLSGGGAMHLVDAVGRNKRISYVSPLHEQACGFAAEGYARLKNSPAVCLVTTGPGGTNALTPLINCWLDSVPVIFISGQVKLKDTIYKNPGLRQFGDQEINIVDMVSKVTKYSKMITEIKTVKRDLQEAFYMSTEGRPGPVWLDVPLDIQAAFFCPDKYRGFTPAVVKVKYSAKKLSSTADAIIEKLVKSKRPLVIAGNGIRISGGISSFYKLIEKIKVPVVTSVLGKDILPYGHKLCTGLPGIAGQRGANFACANSDFILSIGSRLMLRQIGFNYEKFAVSAFKVVVDIDGAEARKKSISADIALECDAKEFIDLLIQKISKKKWDRKLYADWRGQCRVWHARYNEVEECFQKQRKLINSHVFAERFSELSKEGDIVVTSNGTSYIAALQAYKVKKGQRLIYNKASAPMGFGLPAALGVCAAAKNKRIYCFENDGSLQMNIQELQTVLTHKFPLKMVVFNNDGYLSIKLTQKAFFPDNYTACDPKSGVCLPALRKICRAYGIKYMCLKNKEETTKAIKRFMSAGGFAILEVFMDSWQEFLPKVTAAMNHQGMMESKPLEDMYPFLDRDEFQKNMRCIK